MNDLDLIDYVCRTDPLLSLLAKRGNVSFGEQQTSDSVLVEPLKYRDIPNWSGVAARYKPVTACAPIALGDNLVKQILSNQIRHGMCKGLAEMFRDPHYGGIDQKTWQFWRPKIASGSVDEARMHEVKAKCDGTDLIVAGVDAFKAYIGQLTVEQRRLQCSETAARGFANVLFEGVPVVLDKDTPAGEMYFLNTEFLALRTSKLGTDDAAMVWNGALTCSARRYQGAILGDAAYTDSEGGDHD